MWHKDMQDRPFKMAALSDMTVTRRDLVAERKAAEETAKNFAIFTKTIEDNIYRLLTQTPFNSEQKPIFADHLSVTIDPISEEDRKERRSPLAKISWHSTPAQIAADEIDAQKNIDSIMEELMNKHVHHGICDGNKTTGMP